MRIAAVSDIHGNLHALRAVLDDIAARGVDAVVNLGDILSGPLQPVETADLLMGLGLPTIRGNHERQLLDTPRARMGASDAYARDALRADQLEWIAALPATLALNDAVYLCHGTPRDDLEYFLEHLDADGEPRAATPAEAGERAGALPHAVILCGHTHVPRALRLDDGRLLVNPGSVGLQAYAAEHPRPHRMQNGDPRARYALLDDAGGRWQAQLLAIDYDHEAAAAIAQRNGRPDWAGSLRTGLAP
ncbi:metallophosphoesterase family protein [Lysobacter silvisoli]|uniref:Metallophosphoesterase n=1 Tax=Lysobacter silvisoli TaxID=2293254 RepID=A0A371K2B6_9GAMM|nr:metallophosphoesterase family protein [Lysobacter silvisoli]RDZ27987.1 metallophosphoesterase [Lysobacter silvisoli]